MVPKIKVFTFFIIFVISHGISKLTESELDKLALENFRQYLQIPSVHPNVNYDGCVAFIKKLANSIDLPVQVIEVRPKKPVIIITWQGTEPKKPSILLNGHMDVVPVFVDEWIYPPFDAHIDENGNIYARGSQDMKSLSIQQVESIRRLKLSGIRLKRTIHISFVPDEEVQYPGMEDLVKTEYFKNLNIGFVLDEGPSSEDNETINVDYGEKTRFQIWVKCTGSPGHGSQLFNNTAGEKLRMVIDKFMDFRASEKKRMMDSKLQLGEVTSVNLDMIQGGVQVNVIPNELSVAFDMRIAPDVHLEEFEKMIRKWLEEVGEGVNYTVLNKDSQVENTKIDESNIFWTAFKEAADDYGLKLVPRIKPAGSDSRFLRAIGIPALGFAPNLNTPELAHASNEYLNKDVYLKGIDILMKLIQAVANV